MRLIDCEDSNKPDPVRLVKSQFPVLAKAPSRSLHLPSDLQGNVYCSAACFLALMLLQFDWINGFKETSLGGALVNSTLR